VVELALHLASGPGPQSTDARRARGERVLGERKPMEGQPYVARRTSRSRGQEASGSGLRRE
jgi:hypothetical protein